MTTIEIINSTILILTIFAIVIGPILAVKITRDLDEKREFRARRLEVFRALMKTRGVRLSAEHVYALNLIEVEFYKEERVISSYKSYISHLNSPIPENNAHDHYFQTRYDLFVKLLKALGECLEYSFDMQELERLAYVPQGWGNDEETQRMNANLLSEMLQGRRALPVISFGTSQQSPFPPKPEV